MARSGSRRDDRSRARDLRSSPPSLAAGVSEEANRWLRTRSASGEAYDATYQRRAAAGENVHGEADFVQALGPGSVLDAGCGTGRVGRELARRGLDVMGVDIDAEMLGTARTQAPTMDWRLDDLATVDLGRRFEAIVMAGNVMIFLASGTEQAVVSNMASHLEAGGWLIAGFQVQPGRIAIETYDALAHVAGLEYAARFATWDRAPWFAGGNYAVSVHRRPA